MVNGTSLGLSLSDLHGIHLYRLDTLHHFIALFDDILLLGRKCSRTLQDFFN
jgi:hypothetical protein